MTDQWLPTPVHGDKREQAVLDLVPLTGAWRKVMDQDVQAGFLSEATQLQFPQADTMPVTATAIGSNEQLS